MKILLALATMLGVWLMVMVAGTLLVLVMDRVMVWRSERREVRDAIEGLIRESGGAPRTANTWRGER